MPDIQLKNFARSTLSIGAASGATSLTLAAGTGSRFPALTGGQYFYLTLENASLVREIVKVTARAGDVLTVVRAQDGTSATAWNAGDIASLRMNALALDEFFASKVQATSATGSAVMPSGTTAQRDVAPVDGYTRFNSTLAQIEAFFSTTWNRVLTALDPVGYLNVAQQWTARQRTTPLTDNDLSFDLSAANDFVCTPTTGGTLTFTNITAGCKGEILLVNNSNYTIAKAATVKSTATFLTTISATGRYRIAFSSLDGTNVDVTASGALS